MLDALRLLATAAVLVAVAACQGPAPTASPSSSPFAPGGVGGDASASIRLSGREVELAGGHCAWFEGEGKLVVEIGPTAAGDYLKLTAPLAWTRQVLPPGAESADPALEVSLGGNELQVDPSRIDGQMAIDAGSGSYDAQTLGGGSVTGDFQCPTVVDA